MDVLKRNAPIEFVNISLTFFGMSGRIKFQVTISKARENGQRTDYPEISELECKQTGR